MRGKIEAALIARGLKPCGVDEVGRGCLAGPVFSGCMILDYLKLRALPAKDRHLIRDSKTLSKSQRQYIKPIIESIAIEWHVASADAEEIDSIGIVGSTFLAMNRALAQCQQSFDVLLIDGKTKLAGYELPQQAIVKGDNLCFAIAGAAILAKEARDEYMREQALNFPQYGFDSHVGYGTKTHLDSIRTHGICKLHRRSFAPITAYR